MSTSPSYLFLTGAEWDKRINEADRIASVCALCPRRCGVNRFAGEKGFCRAPGEIIVSSLFPHHGEEPPFSGTAGSGTVFFSYCSLQCLFCQNYQLSHLAEGGRSTPENLAAGMIDLQRQGCHNINLVTATHFLPWVLRALKDASCAGLSLPIIYNSGGYELPEVMGLLRGIIDIYLPDMKYGTDGPARRYSGADDYVTINRSAVIEMFRQVGPLRMDSYGIAYRGICIRHLVLPAGAAGSESVLSWLVRSFDPQDLTVSLMAQYRPFYRAGQFPELSRMVSREEYEPVKLLLQESGIGGFHQELTELDGRFCIDFTKRKSEPLTGN